MHAEGANFTGPQSPHSARNLQVTQASDPCRTSEHRRVKLPQASKEKEWLQFDEDIDSISEETALGDAYRCLTTMTTTSLAAMRFGLEEKKSAKKSYTKINRASKIYQLRQELKSVRRRFKVQVRRREELSQGGPGCAVAGPRLRLWFHTPQAGGGGIKPASRSR